MHNTTRPRYRNRGLTRLTAVGLAAVLGTSLLAGCADDSGDEGSKNSEGKKTVSIGLFGVFGYKEAGLYEKYEKLNPGIKIEENVTSNLKDYTPALLTHLSAGSGLQDVQGIEVGNVHEMTQTVADRFVDLGQADGVDKDSWLPWKTAQATTEDGQLIGLGTDVGPMAVCYRKDLFEQAGLPSDREEVSALWEGDWQKYIEAGKEYTKNAPDGSSFVDSGGSLFNASVSGYKERYYNEAGEAIYENSTAVKESWDLAMEAVQAGMTAKLTQFSDAWQKALSDNRIASIACPAWMLGQIKQYAGPSGAGKWDVAAAPKPGNWGGSFLAVPKAAKNQEEGIKLAAWLTAPEQQAELFAKQGNFPSNAAAYDLPELQNAENEYFSGAPTGKIFSQAAEEIPVQVLGPKDQVIKKTMSEVGIAQVEEQGKSPEEGWNAAMKSIENALDK